MSLTPALVEPVQRAAAFVAARSRGDKDAAEAVLADFADDAERAVAFCLLSELAIALLAEHDGEDVDAVATSLAIQIAKAGACGVHPHRGAPTDHG